MPPQNLSYGRPFRDQPWSPEMIPVPPGTFVVGSQESESGRYANEGPARVVNIQRPFAAGRFPVTFNDWDRFCDATGSHRPADQSWGRDRRPVINVSWEDTQQYINWLNAQLHLSSVSERYRLLSEAEWEYAARAGTASIYYWGSQADSRQANFDGRATRPTGLSGIFSSTKNDPHWKSGKYSTQKSRSIEKALLRQPGEFRERTTTVDAFSANPFGLFDMLGNVREWVADVWDDTYLGAPQDGTARINSSNRMANGSFGRITRGGAWNHSAGDLRCAERHGPLPADFRSYVDGFRLARSL